MEDIETEGCFKNFEIESDENVISPKDGRCTRRPTMFLKPCTRNQLEAAAIPQTPLLAEIILGAGDEGKWRPPSITFKGWNYPQKGWKEWVDGLALKYAACWNQTGICGAIVSSVYKVKWNQDLVLGLVEFWCPETNTFIFPWGEATITLEDVMTLGGYPVIGEGISISSTIISKEDSEVLVEFNRARLKLNRSSFCAWFGHFNEENSEFEHDGFLALWLSKHVFPSWAIRKQVLPIAVQLSRGRKLALASAVLASLYKNLTLLREKLVSSSDSVIASGPFHLLLLWAFEHFPCLAPNPPNALEPGEPRVARWHELSVKFSVSQVKSAIVQAGNFEWRPYTADYENWRHPSYYEERKDKLCRYICVNEEMQSYFQCSLPRELVGLSSLDCKEMYRPQRVAMQLGMDQDLPATDSCAPNLAPEEMIFMLTRRSFVPGVSERYFNWWKESMSARAGKIQDTLLHSENVTSRKAAVDLCQNSIESSNGSDDSPLPSLADDNAGSIVIGYRKRNFAGKYGYDDQDAVKDGGFLSIDEGKGKKKAESSAGHPIIIIDEEGIESRTGFGPGRRIGDDQSAQSENTGESMRNPIIL